MGPTDPAPTLSPALPCGRQQTTSAGAPTRSSGVRRGAASLSLPSGLGGAGGTRRVKQGPSRVRRPAGVADDVALRRRPGRGVASVRRKRSQAGGERALRRDSQQLPPPARVRGGNLSALVFGAGEGLGPRLDGKWRVGKKIGCGRACTSRRHRQGTLRDPRRGATPCAPGEEPGAARVHTEPA